jgi:hypothetical protein
MAVTVGVGLGFGETAGVELAAAVAEGDAIATG